MKRLRKLLSLLLVLVMCLNMASMPVYAEDIAGLAAAGEDTFMSSEDAETEAAAADASVPDAQEPSEAADLNTAAPVAAQEPDTAAPDAAPVPEDAAAAAPDAAAAPVNAPDAAPVPEDTEAAAPVDVPDAVPVPEADGIMKNGDPDSEHYFTTQPTGGNIPIAGSYRISWKTSFTPAKVVIGYYYEKSNGGVFPTYTTEFHKTATLDENLSSSMYYDLKYDEANESAYTVRVYYSDTYFVDSNEFNITKTPYQLLQEPSGGNIEVDGTLRLSWRTNYVPTKVVIGYYYMVSSGTIFPTYTTEFHTVKTLTENLKSSMYYDISYDEANESSRYIIRAYYDTGYADYEESSEFSITKTPYQILTHPAGGSIVPADQALTLKWKSNFVPDKVIIGYYYMATTGGLFPTTYEDFREVVTLTEGLSANMSYPLSYDDTYTSVNWVVKLRQPDDWQYLESNRFTITKTDRAFTSHPAETISVSTGGSVPLSWKTNFSSVKAEIYYHTSKGGSTLIHTHAGVGAGVSSSWTLPYSDVYPSGSYTIDVYYNSTYSISYEFSLSLASGVTVSPGEIQIDPNDSVQISWPKVSASRIEVWSNRSGHLEKEASLRGDITSYQVTWKPFPESYAYYDLYLKVFTAGGTHYFSNVISVENLDYVFEFEEGEHFDIEPDQSVTVTFKKSFTPSRIEVWSQDLGNTVNVLSATLPGSADSFDIPYDYGDWVFFYAYYGSGDEHETAVAILHKTERAFTVQPVEEPEDSAQINWYTNFRPTKLELARVGLDENWNATYTVVKTMEGTETTAVIPDNENLYVIRAYYEDYKGEGFVKSNSLKVTGDAGYGFTAHPQSGISEGGELYQAKWAVNFEPSLIEVKAVDEYGSPRDDGDTLFTAETTGSSQNMVTSIQLASGVKECDFRIYAYYWENGDPYISDTFTVTAGNSCGQTLTWTLSGGVLTISGTGAMYDYDAQENPAPWYDRREEITSLVVEEGVASIGNYAFLNCTSLKGISIASSVESIGKGAFSGCTGFSTLTLPSGVKTISERAFYGTSKLGSLTLPDSLTSLGEWAFYMSGLQIIRFGSGLKSIPAGAFASTKLVNVTIPDSITSIGESAFSDISTLSRVTFSERLKTIGEGAFSDCTKLSNVTLPESLNSIGNSAFSGCIVLARIVIPADVTSIGSSAFADCQALTSIHFKGHAPAIGTKAFANVTATATYLVGMGNWTSDVMLNYGGSLTWRGLQKCGDSLTWDLDDSGVLTISGEGGMWDFSSTEAGWYSRKDEITTVDIGYKVTSIGASAFYNCYNLDTVLVGQAVTSVGNYAFRGCSSLNAVVFNGEAPAIEFRAFYGVTTTAYYIPGSTWTSSVMQDYGGTVTWTAAEGMCGDHAFWTIDQDHILHITGSGPMYDWTGLYGFSGSDNIPWVNYIEEIEGVEIQDGITTIGDYAFYTCGAIRYVSMPDSVTSIGKYAFYECGAMESAELSANLLSIGEKAFYRCYQVADIVLPNGLKTIGGDAFYHCDLLTEVTIPDTLTSLGTYAFAQCKNLEVLTVGSGLSAIPTYAFWYCSTLNEVTLPEGLKSIGASAFNGCSSLSEITIPSSVTRIQQYAFMGAGLREITIPATVTEIGLMAFNGCKNLADAYYYDTEENWNANVTLGSMNTDLTNVLHFVRAEGECGADGDNLTWLLEYDGSLLIRGEGAMKDYASNTTSSAWFPYKSDITSVTIREGASSIGNWAFWKCINLTKVVIPETVTSIRSHAFYACSLLEEADIPAHVTSIGESAFASCSSLQRIHIPYGITEIPQDAFRSCSSATELTIPETVTNLGNNAFMSCSSLTELTIPASVNRIASAVFQGCTSLKRVTLADGSTAFGNSMFVNCTSLTSITIPAGITQIPYQAFSGCTALTQVFFKGSAATFGNTPFSKVTATVYYPMDDPTWTESIMQDYGGSLTWVGGICIDAVNFPDENFRDLVLDNFDEDANGWLNQSEIDAVTGFSVEEVDFQTVKGIEYFTELTSLLLDGAPSLKSIDLSKNTKLVDVDISSNGLTSVDLDGLTDLKYLYIAFNNLTWLDVSGLQLAELYCQQNPLVSLELGTQTNLKRLCCYGTNGCLKQLDLRNCPILLDVYQNGTKTVPDWGDRYEITDLGILYLDAGTEVLTSYCIPVYGIYFPDVNFRSYVSTYLDVNHTGWLTPEERAAVVDLVLIDDQIANLDGIEYFTELESLEYCGGLLEALDASALKKLNYLDLSGQKKLTSLNIDGLTALEYLYVYDTGLTSLDVSGSSGLVYLECYDTPLVSLTLGSQEHMTLLGCYGTNLTELNLYGCPILLDAYENGTSTAVKAGCVEYKGPLGGTLRVDAETEIITDEPAGTYMLWLGDTQVTDQNKSNILGDGSASYDPESGTLTFTKTPAVTGVHNGALIYANGIDLNISAASGLTLNSTGEAAIYAANNGSLVIFGNITVRGSGSYGLRAKNITIYGDVDIEAKESALYTYNGDIKIYGNVKAVATADTAGISAHAIFATRGITIDGDVTASANHIAMYARSGGIRMLSGTWTLQGGTYAILSGSNLEIIIPDDYEITTPSGGVFAQTEGAEETLWTVMEADGTTIAKKAVIGPKLFVLAGANMTLGNELSMNFFVNKADIDTTKDYYIKVTKTYADGRANAVLTVPFKEWTNYNSTYYSVKFNGVSAKEMNDLIYVQVFYADDTPAAEVWEDSVAEYVLRILERQNAVTKTMLVDMLNYGAAAQTFFGYDTAHLANSQLTEAQKAYASSGATTEDHRIKGENYYGSNLNLGSNLKFSVFFTDISPDMYAVATFTKHTGTAQSIRIDGSDFELYNASKSIYRIYIEEMVVADARQLITCTVYDADGTAVASASDSIESYIARMTSSNALYTAIMKFADSAYAYFHQ